MNKIKESTKKSIKIVSIIVMMTIVLSIVGFFIFVSYDYKAENSAREMFESDKDITVVDNLIIVQATEPSDTGIIFYPGAKVEAISYLPILEKLKENGITSVLVDMPFKMAIFNSNAANDVFKLVPKVENWYIGGHSMGGAMASNYASKNQDKVEGLILLGAYVYGEYPPQDALTVYGTFNSNLEKNIDYDENIIIIDGGNHAQFGNYGQQKGDPQATISTEEQQRIAVEAILDFIKNKN